MISRKLAVFTLFVVIQNAYLLNACVTPNNEPGTCIVLTSCPLLFSYVQTRPIPRATIILLRKSACGFEGNLPKVCCPSVQQTQTNDDDLFPGLDICGQNTQDRIFGGKRTELGEFPWMALLEYKKPNGKGFHCGGALISSRYVLTAAHCIAGSAVPKSYRLVSVRLGEHDTSTDPDCTLDGDCSDPPIDVPIETILVHEAYEPDNISQPNDIALLRLTRPITFTDYIHPICLPHKNNAVVNNTFVDKDLDVAGWGRTEKGSKSDVKLKVKVPVVDNSACKTQYQQFNALITEKQICAGGKAGEDSCQGDSGGPLMAQEYTTNTRGANWYCIGIVSFGGRCGTKGLPGIYTNVGQYTSWIKSKVLP